MFQNILVPLDGSTPAEATLLPAREVDAAFHARISAPRPPLPGRYPLCRLPVRRPPPTTQGNRCTS